MPLATSQNHVITRDGTMADAVKRMLYKHRNFSAEYDSPCCDPSTERGKWMSGWGTWTWAPTPNQEAICN